MKDRTEGYKQALSDSGIKVDENLIRILPFSHDNKDVDHAIRELAGDRSHLKADAILFSTSKIGVMGIECITGMGLKIPEEIAVVSFDNADAYKICVSPVTVIAQPIRKMGQTAVRILLNNLAHPEAERTPEKILLKTEFIVRKSCGS
jgi:LacI family transcriptional regulator